MSRNKDYSAYIKYYNAEKKKMKKQGFSMFLPKLTKNEWKIRYGAMLEDRKDAISNGERKIIGNINRDIAVSQKWEKSKTQAQAIIKHWNKANGKKPKIKEVQAGKFNPIKERYDILIKSGIDKSEASSIITDEFYGGSK